MQRLEAKSIHGRTYYYLSQWGWTEGRCRRLSQKYLGRIEDIARALQQPAPQPAYALVLDWGLPLALWQEAGRCQIAQTVDQLCPKRSQGLSTGHYIQLAAVNRACEPVSKQAMWDWFSQTCLPRVWPEASAAQLTSQHFWDHMDRIDADTAQTIWQQLITEVLQREQIQLSQICYDGTNFYTFIDTFNLRCHVAKRGKNKQGRGNLRQVSYALFCTTDGHLPLFYDVYEGNRNDSTEFPRVLEKFQRWLKEQTGSTWATTKPTLIFDKGNNSADNFALVDSLELPYVGSAKLDEHPAPNRSSHLAATHRRGLGARADPTVPSLLRRHQLLHLHRHVQPQVPGGQTRQEQARTVQSAASQLCAVLHDRGTPAALLRRLRGQPQ